VKPTILAVMRPNNFELLKKIYALDKFDLVLYHNAVEQLFIENKMQYESLYKYFSHDVLSKSNAAFLRIGTQWENLLDNKKFQDEFVIKNKQYFDLIRNDINALFLDQSHTCILLIEAFKNLYLQKNLSLVLVWTDVIHDIKAITYIAHKYNVRVLQLMHGAFGTMKVGNFESEIYSDKVAAFGSHRIEYFGEQVSRDSVILTGDPDKDKFFDGSSSFDKTKICRELGFDPHSKIVFFGSTWTGSFTIGSFRNIQETTIKEFLKALKNLQDEQPTLQLAIKLHPTEYGKSDQYKQSADEAGVKNYRIFESHLYELLYISDIYTGFRSSIIINALIFGKPVLLFDFYEISDYKFFEGLAIKWILKPEDIYPNLKTYLYDENAINGMKKLIPESVEYFNYKSDGQATKRVIDLVCEMADETLSSPAKEITININPPQAVTDSRIFDHIDFGSNKVLFINSMKNLNMDEVLKRKGDSVLYFVEDGPPSSQVRGESVVASLQEETITAAQNVLNLDLKNESIDSLGLEKESFDYIVFKNSLETLYDPWTWLKNIQPYIKTHGKVLVETANIRNINVFSSIINGYFTYSDNGIVSFDKLRFFTPAELSISASNAGYEIADVHHFMDASLGAQPRVSPGQAYNFQGNNFVLNNIPGESLLEMYSDHSLITLKKQISGGSFTSPLHLPKPEDYFENPRLDLIEMMDKAPETILEIGCGIGMTCVAIRNRYPACKTIGIDIDEVSIQKAAAVIDKAIIADIEKTELSKLGIEEESLDYILYGDVLEHFENPWEILRTHKRYLKKYGQILASIPNIRHNSVLASLLYGRWTYAFSGILDVTHLRFFTLREIKRLFRSAGLYIYDIKGNPDIKPEDLNLPSAYAQFSFNIRELGLQNIPREEIPEFSIIQFLVKAGKEGKSLLK
jgi:2-polyprenyl-3-methyl-5-hydroxy-6-metoxy-1,4-benzoquinol methylase